MADPVTSRRISYAQNAEDVRVWRAFADRDPIRDGLAYVDVGANEPRHLSITASLYDMGWRGLLIEADPVLADELRVHRPADRVVEMAASDGPGELEFFRVPGTGLGTLDAAEAEAARARGFAVEAVAVPTDSLDAILDAAGMDAIHFLSIDVEGAEAVVLQGLSLERHRPWVMCVEAVLPGTSTPSHHAWEPGITGRGYRLVAFDGVNRWYVADEHGELADAVAVPFNAIDAGQHGWVPVDQAMWHARADRADVRRAWQRELILHDVMTEVPVEEYERQIAELRGALVAVEGSRSLRYARRITRVGKGALFRARRLKERLPGAAQDALVRRRHLRHVTVNMGHLTPAALLGPAADPGPAWITPEGLPEPPARGLGWEPLTGADVDAVRAWLDSGRQGPEPWDSDAMLVRRVDNHDDELGRTVAALRTRLRLAEGAPSPLWAGGNRVVVDARCLQTSAFGHRGIGRFARAALLAVREAVGDDRVTLVVDDGLEELPDELAGGCRQVARITERTLPAHSVLVQPSPMTASPDPLLPLLLSDAHKVAVVFDLIPLHHPTVYLGNVAARAEYAACLDALRRYDEFVCISHVVARELPDVLGRPADGPDAIATAVAWPRDVRAGSPRPADAVGTGPIVLMTGDDARKNTFGGLAGIGAATAGRRDDRDVVVLGMAGQADRVHHWSIAAMMRPGEARTAERISDDEMRDLLAGSSLVVVPSFDEGLSLPVIEALAAGAPVVASDIPAHRELIGSGSFLADPRSPASLARAIRRTARSAAAHRRQAQRLAAHRHEDLETVITRSVSANVRPADVVLAAAPAYAPGRPLDIGIAGPWPPQRTGVADFTAATVVELARLADVTVYATAGADVAGTLPPGVDVRCRSVDDLLAGEHQHDVLVSIVGNSHFHLPFLQVVARHGGVVITHDTRLVELYLALRGRGGVEQVMLRGTGRRALSPPLDDQIDDMRLLESTAFWEVARRSRVLVAHTPTAAPFMAEDTGRPIHLLPFANYRRPEQDILTEAMREEARARLGFDDAAIHLGSFGYIDTRTKLSDVVLESAAWLEQWGHRVHLHLVGSAPDSLADDLRHRAAAAGLTGFEVTGFVDDATFRDYALAVDLGVQLRISPLLGVSGPLSDMAAFGTPAVASRGLCEDVDTPDFIDRLPDDVSPVIVAEAIERRLADPLAFDVREELRRDYLARKSPARYAEQLLALLVEVARTPDPREG